MSFFSAMVFLLLFVLCDCSFPKALGWLVILLCLASAFGFGTFVMTFR